MTQTPHVRFAALVAAGFFAGTAGATGAAYADTTTSGNGSIGGGNQVVTDLDAPINVCGNAIAVLGIAGADCTDGEATVTETSSTTPPGYDPEYPEEPEEPVEETPEEPVEEETPEEEVPEEPVEEETPEEEIPEEPIGEKFPEEPTTEPSESAAPSAPPADESRLAVTGTDQSAVTALVAAAILAVAAGSGLLLFGKRRRAQV